MDEDYIPVESIRKPSMMQPKQDLQASIDNLNQSINSLIGLFKEASESMKMEEAEASLIAKKIDPIFQKLEEVSEQNKKIARGIVAIADMIEEKLGQRRAPERPSMPPSAMPQQSMGPGSGILPPPSVSMRPAPLPPRPPMPPAPR